MKLKCDEPLSNVAFNLSVSRYVEGVVCGSDPGNAARVVVRLADGTEVSVKRENYLEESSLVPMGPP